MDQLLNWLPGILSAGTPVLTEALGLLLAIPLASRLVLLLWVTWVMYLAYASLEGAYKRGQVGKVAKVLAIPLLLVFWPLDVLFNVTLFSVMFWEWPKELTITARLSRHHRESTGWRYKMAKWFGAELLDPYDADGHHIDRDPREV